MPFTSLPFPFPLCYKAYRPPWCSFCRLAEPKDQMLHLSRCTGASWVLVFAEAAFFGRETERLKQRPQGRRPQLTLGRGPSAKTKMPGAPPKRRLCTAQSADKCCVFA
ncbi:hypothetical protein U9M48_003880 [Paspalum notatum var. saurae]|uniref:Uncharacterized protein n=1 Tax=Paspalum notatum var. saurae TaxID=547442 RepID=A0AAQ3PS31_PASNO